MSFNDATMKLLVTIPIVILSGLILTTGVYLIILLMIKENKDEEI